MAYDPVHKVTLLYDGGPLRGYPYFDAWTWNGRNWSQQPSPGNRRLWGAAMAYDEALRRVVLLATTRASGEPVDGVPGETWTWDGSNWRQEHPSLAPNARQNPHMVYDSRRKQVIMFGGVGYKSETFADTWAWDGTNWRKLSNSIPGLADGGLFGAAAYDPATDRTVLCDQLNSQNVDGMYHGGMWLFDGSVWTEKSAVAAPLPTTRFGMVYDPAIEKLVLFGGEVLSLHGDVVDGVFKSDIWTSDGQTWQRQPGLMGPSPRMAMAISYDTDLQQVLIFGGTGNSGGHDIALGDTWSWNGATWSKLSG